MFSIGYGDVHIAQYQDLPQGDYVFRVAEFDIFGKPTGNQDSITILVPPPFWRTSWFWGGVLTSTVAVVIGTGRYLAWRRMRLGMLRLQNQQAFEKERLR